MLSAAIALLWMGCSVSNSLMSKANQRPYDFEASILHPQCTALPLGIDSVEIFLEWSREESLFLRDSPQSPFTAYQGQLTSNAVAEAHQLSFERPQGLGFE